MKLTITLAFFLGVASHVKACIRVHARHFQAPWPEWDGLGIEVWDNDNVYERCSCAWQSYAGQDCTAKCGKFTVTIGRYGRGGRVTNNNNNNGYSAPLKTQEAAKPENWCCVLGNKGECRGQCQVWDNCSWDAFGNCNKYDCSCAVARRCVDLRGARSGMFLLATKVVSTQRFWTSEKFSTTPSTSRDSQPGLMKQAAKDGQAWLAVIAGLFGWSKGGNEWSETAS